MLFLVRYKKLKGEWTVNERNNYGIVWLETIQTLIVSITIFSIVIGSPVRDHLCVQLQESSGKWNKESGTKKNLSPLQESCVLVKGQVPGTGGMYSTH